MVLPYISPPGLPIGRVAASVNQNMFPARCSDQETVSLPHIDRSNFKGSANCRRKAENKEQDNSSCNQLVQGPFWFN